MKQRLRFIQMNQLILEFWTQKVTFFIAKNTTCGCSENTIAVVVDRQPNAIAGIDPLHQPTDLCGQACNGSPKNMNDYFY
jgi:hypothetical protein